MIPLTVSGQMGLIADEDQTTNAKRTASPSVGHRGIVNFRKEIVVRVLFDVRLTALVATFGK
jgi:hypothetical protein